MLRRSHLGLVTALAPLFACGGAIDTSSSAGSGETAPSATTASPPPPSGYEPGPPVPGPPSSGTCTPLAAPFEDGFEGAFSTKWSAANLMALKIDTTSPIAGTSSLAVAVQPSPTTGYLALPVAGACAATFAFTVRAGADLLASQSDVHIARVMAGPVTLWIAVAAQRGITVSLEERLSGAVSLTPGIAIAALDPTTPTRVVVQTDAERGTIGVAAGPTSAPLPPTAPMKTKVSPGPLTRVEIGAVVGIQRVATGTVWFDDVELR